MVRHGGVGDVASADVVVVEVDAIGPGGVVLDADDIGLIEAARAVGVPVWVEGGVGRVMPPKLWEAMVRRIDVSHHARSGVVVDLDGIDRVAGPRRCPGRGRRSGLERLPRARRAVGALVRGRSTIDVGDV